MEVFAEILAVLLTLRIMAMLLAEEFPILDGALLFFIMLCLSII